MKTIAQNEERKQPKIKTEMNGKGLTVHEGVYGVYEEAGAGNLSGRQWFFFGRVAGVSRVSIGWISD